MYCKEKLEEIHKLIEKMGANKAAKKLNIALETILRSDRYYRNSYKKEKEKKKGPNILLLDIETAPSSAYVWNFFKTYINQEQVITDWFMLGWAVKWLFEPDVYSGFLTTEEALAKDDKRITKDLWEYIDSADIIIGHNVSGFDIPKINTRFMVHGLLPPSPYYQIDTLVTLKKQFGFSNNKMNYVNSVLGLGQKEHTTFQLWVDYLNGELQAAKDMESYCVNDVLILEELYVKLRPWIKSHPNVGIFMDTDGITCPYCGSTSLEYCGEYTTPISSYHSYRCLDVLCGAISRGRHNTIPKLKKDKLLRSIAK